jgi:hypothetical protein
MASHSRRPRLESPPPRKPQKSRQRFFLFPAEPGSAVGPIQWVPRVPSLGKSGRGVKLITDLQLAPRLRTRGVTAPFHIHLDGMVFNDAQGLYL